MLGHASVDTAPVTAGGLVTVVRAPRDAADAASPRVTSRTRPVPADGLLHPLSLLALVLLLLNDHVLKAAWPSLLTGKLSDVAGLVVFPLVVVAAWETVLVGVRRWREPTARPLALAVVVTGIAFTLVKTIPMVAIVAGWLVGRAQWLLSLPIHAIAGTPLAPVIPTAIVVDPTDLLALPCLAVAVWIGRSRLR